MKRKNRRKRSREELELYDIEMPKDILIIVQDGKCFYCGEKKEKLTKDHFYPKCRGYSLLGNTVLACYDCNTKKGGKIPDQIQAEKFKQMQMKIKEMNY